MLDLLVTARHSPAELLLLTLAVPGLLLCFAIFFTAYMSWRAKSEHAPTRNIPG